jgi:isopenicillin N synthase-like dioxygenase
MLHQDDVGGPEVRAAAGSGPWRAVCPHVDAFVVNNGNTFADLIAI